MDKQGGANNNSDIVIAQSLAALIYASSWPKTRKVLEEQQNVLLLDRALELLSYMIVESYIQGNIEDAKNLTQYEELLARARVSGIALAWKDFIPL